MSQRFIDLSMPISNTVVTDPEPLRPKIQYTTHKESVPQLAMFFPELKASDLPDGEGWAVEDITLTTHSGTHMDAPWHYHSTSEGKRAASIDEAPLEWFMKPAVKFDFRHFPDGYVVTAKDIEDELKRIQYELKPLDIVLINTSASAAYGGNNYVDSGCGMGHEATMYLTERGVRVVGTDAWSWDAPFKYTAERFAKDGDPSIIWEGHKAGRFIGYYQIEKLFGLEQLPDHGFTLCCFPVKIEKASAGWIRAVAIIEEENE